MRYLAVDPGAKKIGLAISDPTGTIARPLGVLAHISRTADAVRIAAVAAEQGAAAILVGLPLDAEGRAGPAARSAIRLAEALRQATQLPVSLCDESSSSRQAQQIRLAAGRKRKARRAADDALAAAVILQNYLDTHVAAPPASK